MIVKPEIPSVVYETIMGELGYGIVQLGCGNPAELKHHTIETFFAQEVPRKSQGVQQAISDILWEAETKTPEDLDWQSLRDALKAPSPEQIEAAQKLGVEADTMSHFEAEDTFNPGNTLRGYICRRSDKNYGALVLTHVNGEPAPQVIYGTPKLRYPFGRTELEGRRYHFTPTDEVRAYEKWDGTNICCFSYADATGQRFVSYKTRLTPIVKSSKFGDFAGMWGELLEEFPGLRAPACVLSGEYSLSYEMYGYRNSHTILYKEALTTTLLFGVRQSDGAVQIPEFFLGQIPDKFVGITEAMLQTNEDLISFYENMRAAANSLNKKKNEYGQFDVGGTEGYIFYLRCPATEMWSQWKCLDGRSGVLTREGWRTISSLVTSKSTVEVASYSQRQICFQPITGWHKSPIGGRSMIWVGLTNAPLCGNGFVGCNVTTDHKFLTTRGFVEAGKLKPSDRIYTGELQPNDKQMEVFDGTMLGDASIAKGEARLIFSQVDHEWGKLKESSFGLLMKEGRIQKRKGVYDYNPNQRDTYESSSTAAIWVRQQKKRWYPNGIKTIPQDLKITDLVLATWFLDDGNLHRTYATFATNSFSLEEVERLRELLLKEGMESRLKNAKTGYTIRLTTEGTKTLLERIGKYIPPGMGRKKFENSENFQPELWDLGNPIPGHDTPIFGESTTPNYEKTVYCIDVQTTHNFVTKAGVVHNCKPESIELLHWAGDSIPQDIVTMTAWNALESCPGDLTEEYLRKLLSEEFTPEQIAKSNVRVTKAIQAVKSRIQWRERVMEAFQSVGLEFTPETKIPIMRQLSTNFEPKQMKFVYSALRELGIVKE